MRSFGPTGPDAIVTIVSDPATFASVTFASETTESPLKAGPCPMEKSIARSKPSGVNDGICLSLGYNGIIDVCRRLSATMRPDADSPDAFRFISISMAASSHPLFTTNIAPTLSDFMSSGTLAISRDASVISRAAAPRYSP